VARDRVRKVGRRLWRAHAAAVLTDIDLHENVKRGPRAGRRLGEAREGFDVVHDRGHMNVRGEGCETGQLGSTDEGRRNQDIIDPPADQRLGLTDLGAADPHRARLALHGRDDRALVRLSVRAQPLWLAGTDRGHGGDIGLKHVEVDQQGRRVDRVK
jgi:hypothetical protein